MPEDYEPPLIVKPLTVHVVEGEVVLDGELKGAAVLSPDAAVATGEALIEAGRSVQS